MNFQKIIEDIELETPLKSFNEIEDELKNYSEEVSQRSRLVVITKIDVFGEGEISQAKKIFTDAGFEVTCISSATGEGVKELVALLSKRVAEGIPIAAPSLEMQEKSRIFEDTTNEHHD